MKSKTEITAEAESFCIVTLGCKINQYETEALREAWLARGLAERPGAADADLVVINACAVTARAVADVRASVRAANRENPEAAIIVVGCVAEQDRATIAKLPGVAEILPQRAKAALAGLKPFASDGAPGEATDEDGRQAAPKSFPALRIADYPRARAVLKIQDGCSHGCSYCIVPLTRGASVSRPEADILAEAERLLAAGVREISLSGVNLRHYGRGLGKGMNLWRLVRHLEKRLAPEWGDRARLRLSSLDPAQLTDEALETLSESRMLCPHLHLSLQSLAPAVLGRMHRGHYGPEDVHRFLDRLGAVWPVFGLGADFISGFPGESEGDAERTLEAAAALPLTYAHVFPYSRRPGTAAAAMSDQVPEPEKKARAARLRALAGRKARTFLKRLAAQERLDVVLENDSPWRGRCQHYVECRVKDGAAMPPEVERRTIVACRPVGGGQGFIEVEPLG
ncbi:RNA modification enzyme, MiaB family [Desulfovibrio sp. X2]|uniref:MiaB/RimO family radical SAM methylthiotransferase n=1 Tax=Desulfovibrio sp. X2 TaxID=941449 RepID=UPI0003589A01|nr:MiaB/RimO family radical SAM methylthiotransferase [Desulfovibrio sp. X2]EPR41453.1 RNA modification enzyme, MiaB family [Desulfovibrio sp. X2]